VGFDGAQGLFPSTWEHFDIRDPHDSNASGLAQAQAQC
jgi:hypothetical protein